MDEISPQMTERSSIENSSTSAIGDEGDVEKAQEGTEKDNVVPAVPAAVATAEAEEVSPGGSISGATFSGCDLDKVVNAKKSQETILPIQKPETKPYLMEKFREKSIQAVIRHIIEVHLGGVAFDQTKVKEWCTLIADGVSGGVKTLGYHRYKHVVQVVLAERNGAGVKCGFKCLWDKQTDGFASDYYINETLFCVCSVYCVYFY